MTDDTLPKIEYTDEETTVGSHYRKYICVQGGTLSECYEYFLKVRRSNMTSSTQAVSECKYSKKCSRYDAESYTCTHGESDNCGHYKAIKGIRL